MTQNSCLTCLRAEWHRTANGRLHPSGSGRCNWQMPSINAPKAFYWMGGYAEGEPPRPSGGFIDRKRPHTECPAWRGKVAE